MTRVLLLVYLAFSLAGCVTSGPPDNVDFRNVSKIKDLEGIYQNLGSGDKDARPLYLSYVIWPKDTALHHSAISTIEVEATNASTLVLKARDPNGVVVKEAAFVEGQDFDLESGRILLRKKFKFAGFGDDPMVGPEYDRTELGLDKRGDAKYSDQTEFVGLVMMLIPLAIGVKEEVRFVKLDAVKAERKP